MVKTTRQRRDAGHGGAQSQAKRWLREAAQSLYEFGLRSREWIEENVSSMVMTRVRQQQPWDASECRRDIRYYPVDQPRAPVKTKPALVDPPPVLSSPDVSICGSLHPSDSNIQIPATSGKQRMEGEPQASQGDAPGRYPFIRREEPVMEADPRRLKEMHLGDILPSKSKNQGNTRCQPTQSVRRPFPPGLDITFWCFTVEVNLQSLQPMPQEEILVYFHTAVSRCRESCHASGSCHRRASGDDHRQCAHVVPVKTAISLAQRVRM